MNASEPRCTRPAKQGRWAGAWPALLALLVLVGCARPPAAPPRPDGLASVSRPLALTPDGATLWVVNPDADSATAIDTATLAAQPPVPVGDEPWAAAVAPDGTVVVLARGAGSLAVLANGRRSDIPVGPEPGGLALSPTGRLAYVSLSLTSEVAVVDLESLTIARRIAVGRAPWALAVTDDGDSEDDDETVIVLHRFARLRAGGGEARDDGKEAWLTLLRPDGNRDEVVLGPYAFGFPNLLGSPAVAGNLLLLPHLLNSPELPASEFDPGRSVDRRFETSISGALSAVALGSGRELPGRRLHINDSAFSTPVNFPAAVALAPDGKRAYLVLAGTDAVMGIDLSDPTSPTLLGFWPVGNNPRGIVLDATGERAFVMNFLSRDVSVLDLADTISRRELARIPAAPETLEPQLLRGKILFHNASDPRLSHLGWISCASCHPDGGSDATTWVGPGEGARQTMPLFALDGTAPFHISATRDEVQDFEDNIEGLMDGVGLAPGAAKRLLGEPNGGRSSDLDALAAYVLRGVRTPRAPAGDPDAVARGRAVFEAAGCAACHGGPAWTRSSLPGPPGTLAPNGEEEVLAALRDVGTFAPSSDVLGANGFDVPTLLGLAGTAPYLHDGSAATLDEVLDNPQHAPPLTAGEKRDLVAFLLSIDERTPFFP